MKNIITKEEKDRIDSICQKYKIMHYSINSDGSIDVNGGVTFFNKGLTELPLRFNRVSGYFSCMLNNLTTLDGSPNEVYGNFDCSGNSLVNLDGGPSMVDGNYDCGSNHLTTLIGAPSSVSGDFRCSSNRLTSLEGAPKFIGDDFDCMCPIHITYSGHDDIEFIGGECSLGLGNLPRLMGEIMVNNQQYIKLILKYQRPFMIWNEDLTLNEENFNDLISEIEEGLE